MLKIALIPAYEPGEILINILAQLQDAGFECVVVNDGSGPEYTDIFQRASERAAVLNHSENRGKGAAIKTGLAYIGERYHGSFTVTTVDADGQHRAQDALRTAEEAEARVGVLALGSRAFTGRVPLRSRMGNAITRGVFRLSTGVRVWDTQTGLRAFDSTLLPIMQAVKGERYEYEMNMLLDCARMGIPIHETTIETVYINGNSGSHFNVLRDSALIYGEIFKFAASSFTGFLVDYGLYSLLVLTTAGLGTASVPLSNVTARIVSASVNFTINKKLVFKSDASALRTGAQYFALAACILCGNTFLLSWLVNGLGVNRFAGKIVTEITFFTISWFAQKFIIFKRPVKRRAIQ